MTTCGPVTKSLLLLAVVVALTGQGSALRQKRRSEKFSDCCKRVTKQEITETIVDYTVQKKDYQCVNAVIFKTESGKSFCCKHDEPWVKMKVAELDSQSEPVKMTTCGPVTKSLLLLAVVVALTGQESAVPQKFSVCCTRVTRQEITETIVDYMVQQRNYHCVNAVIFLVSSGQSEPVKMTTCGTVTKSLLLLAVVVALTGHGSAADWKVSECCTTVARKEITETIVDYMVQHRNNHCVNAIIFQTESGGLYCFKHDEPWVMRKVMQLRGTKRAALASNPSLLKLITSSSSTHYTVQ
ncbi:unnamed protein product [Gadus morhua 'NCC']